MCFVLKSWAACWEQIVFEFLSGRHKIGIYFYDNKDKLIDYNLKIELE